MLNQFLSIKLLLGIGEIERLHNARIVVFVISRVGEYVCEALVRNGRRMRNEKYLQIHSNPVRQSDWYFWSDTLTSL